MVPMPELGSSRPSLLTARVSTIVTRLVVLYRQSDSNGGWRCGPPLRTGGHGADARPDDGKQGASVSSQAAARAICRVECGAARAADVPECPSCDWGGLE